MDADDPQQSVEVPGGPAPARGCRRQRRPKRLPTAGGEQTVPCTEPALQTEREVLTAGRGPLGEPVALRALAALTHPRDAYAGVLGRAPHLRPPRRRLGPVRRSHADVEAGPRLDPLEPCIRPGRQCGTPRAARRATARRTARRLRGRGRVRPGRCKRHARPGVGLVGTCRGRGSRVHVGAGRGWGSGVVDGAGGAHHLGEHQCREECSREEQPPPSTTCPLAARVLELVILCRGFTGLRPARLPVPLRRLGERSPWATGVRRTLLTSGTGGLRSTPPSQECGTPPSPRSPHRALRLPPVPAIPSGHRRSPAPQQTSPLQALARPGPASPPGGALRQPAPPPP